MQITVKSKEEILLSVLLNKYLLVLDRKDLKIEARYKDCDSYVLTATMLNKAGTTIEVEWHSGFITPSGYIDDDYDIWPKEWLDLNSIIK